MKKLSILILSLGLAFGTFAQGHPHFGGGVRVVRPRIIVGGPLYPSLGYGYGYGLGLGYNPYYGYNPMYRSSRPSRLDLEIEDIKNDYQDRIWSAKNDNTLSRRERRQKVHELKHERDGAIIDAKRNYYKRDYSS